MRVLEKGRTASRGYYRIVKDEYYHVAIIQSPLKTEIDRHNHVTWTRAREYVKRNYGIVTGKGNE